MSNDFNLDAYVTKINHVKAHPNADRLELAYIKNWQCVIGKGDFKTGDTVLFIQPDAIIKEPVDKDYFDWALGVRRYLAGKGRVRIVTLRGELSNGLIVNLDSVRNVIASSMDEYDYVTDEIIANISPLTLCDILGIGHYTPPVPSDLCCKSASLPPGIEKSDEINFQALDENDLHLGEKALLTKKLDGTSGTIYYDPATGDISFHSRSMTLYADKDNNYTLAMRPYVDVIKALGDFYGEPIALRGEICGNSINASAPNRDARGRLQFYLYGVRFPKNNDPNIRYGVWTKGRHFTDVVNQAKKLGFFNLTTVPIIGEEVITMELLRHYENIPAEFGEGIVINGSWDTRSHTSSYKCKSAPYYEMMK